MGERMSNQTFELERFAWATPDRLEIDGRFVGLGGATGDPVLVLRGIDGTHRLPAVTEDIPDGDGEHWHAVFAWQEAPTAFDAAQLELGDELLIELPEPSWDGEPPELGVLDVRRRGGGERLRLQADVLAVRSELGEAHARAERLEKELARARADVDEERAGRAADAESFRDSLAQAQSAAEEAIAEGLAEVDALRVRVAELAGAGEEAERLRAQLTSIRDILDDGAGDRRDAGGDATSP
jgi:hypothetical protein